MERDTLVVGDGGRWEGPFTAADAAVRVAELRDAGLTATDRPVGGGHLEAWLRHTAPVVIGRLCVRLPWAEAPTPPTTVVTIDPGRAWGAGSHPTTKLLLAALDRRLRGGERVLDVGCGSGILAVAAAALGASDVVAYDIDPEAHRMTARNAERNGVTIAVGNRPGPYDVVVANIGAHVLIDLAPALVDRVAPGGWLGLGGLSPAQLSTVAAAFRPLEVEEELHDDDWAAMVLRSCATITT